MSTGAMIVVVLASSCFVASIGVGASPIAGLAVAALAFALGVVCLLGRAGHFPLKLPWAVFGFAASTFLIATLGSLGAISRQHDEQLATEQAREAARRNEAEQAAAAAALRAQTPQRLADARAALERMTAATTSGQFEQAQTAAASAHTQLASLVTVTSARDDVQAMTAQAEAGSAAAAVMITARDTPAAALALATAPTPGDVITYDDQLQQYATTLSNLPDAARQRYGAAIQAAAAAIDHHRHAIHAQVERARHTAAVAQARADRAAAEQAALTTLCGASPPIRGAWDNEIVGSESYLRRTANDPGSIDVENCSPPVLTREHCWESTCTVRGRNAFNALIARQVVFSVGANNTILGADYVD